MTAQLSVGESEQVVSERGAVGAPLAAVHPTATTESADAERRSRWVGSGLVALAGICYGVQNILAKEAYAGGAGVPTVLAARFVVAAIAVWAVLLVARRRGWRPAVRQPVPRVLGFAVLGLLFVTNALFAYLALERLPAGTTTLLVFVFPALVVLWSRLFFREPLGRRKVACLAVALLGCLLVVDPGAALAADSELSWLGVLLAGGSALSNSWYATLAGPLGRGVSGLLVAAYSLPVTAICFAVGLVLLGGPSGDVSVAGWVSCFVIGLLAGLAVACVLGGIGRIGPSRAAIVSTSEPAASVVLGALVLGETLTPVALLGGACVVAAILVLSQSRTTGP